MLRDIRRRELVGVGLAPSARVWSLARRGIAANSVEVAAAGKSVARLAIILQSCNDHDIPWLVVHPSSSSLWKTESGQAIIGLGQSSMLDQCQFGSRFRKRTTVVYGGGIRRDDTSSLQRLCMGARALCSSTGKPHLECCGRYAGLPHTAHVQRLPARLTRALARTLVGPARAFFLNV